MGEGCGVDLFGGVGEHPWGIYLCFNFFLQEQITEIIIFLGGVGVCTSVVISRGFFWFFPCNHFMDIKKTFWEKYKKSSANHYLCVSVCVCVCVCA